MSSNRNSAAENFGFPARFHFFPETDFRDLRIHSQLEVKNHIRKNVLSLNNHVIDHCRP